MCTYKRNNWTTKATLTTSSHQEALGLPNSNTLLTTPQPYWWQHARTTNKHFQPHTWIHKLPGNTKITEGTSKILNRFTIKVNELQEQSWPPQANRKQGSPNSNTILAKPQPHWWQHGQQAFPTSNMDSKTTMKYKDHWENLKDCR